MSGNTDTASREQGESSKERKPSNCSAQLSLAVTNQDVNFNSEDASSQDIPRPYSVFTKVEKRLIIFLVTFAATFSPLSSFIFFPAVTSLSSALHVSLEKINLTITSYMIVASIAPAVMGDMADMTGRRIVYILTLGIYCAANVGLALQHSWAALFVLRMLQSAGGAATIAIGYGTVSDIAAPAERGGYVGILLLGPNVATAIGPVLGGALAHAGWQWIFWFLTLAAASCLLLILVFLPETSRFIVGNGTRPVTGVQRSLLFYLRLRKELNGTDDADGQEKRTIARQDEPAPKPFKFPNPLASLRVLLARDAVLITSIYGIYYMNFSCLQASMSNLVIDLYGYTEVVAGLLYLPFGVGSIVGAYCSGRIMDHDYRSIARSHNITIDKKSGDDLTKFPIEKARFRSIWYFIGLTGVCTIGYGWALHTKAHISVALILQFIIGGAIAITFNMCGTLLTDLHPKAPAAAQAANNVVRGSLAAAGLAFLQKLLDAVGTGWTFTFFGGVCLACMGCAWLEWQYGSEWRKRMRAKGIER